MTAQIATAFSQALPTFTPALLAVATDEELSQLRELYRQAIRLTEQNRIESYYPDEGPLRRELYVKHMEFFRAAGDCRERCMLAANRVGKTEAVGGYELTLHLTGRYPDWWVGRRFDRPVRAWAAGDTGKTVRDIVQAKLLGPPSDPGQWGTGLIPGDCIVHTPSKPGVPDAVETITVRHVSGGTSVLQLKSYDQGRVAFQGTEQEVIWLDEEPPLDVYTESLLRLMTTGGILMATFTPLEGLSDTVMHYLPDGKLPDGEAVVGAARFLVMASWDDVPHLTKEVKDALWAALPPHQRDARSKGIPQLGSGAIFPVPESELTCDPFEIPEYWPRVFALDVGWNRTAAIWLAIDRESQTVYAYSEHYRGQAEPSVHAEAIRARGEWIPGDIDPAARGRSQKDGEQLLQQYTDLGLNLTAADNAVEAGIYAVWQRLSGGRLKVFRTLQNWLAEYRVYRRDDKGRVVKSNDHLQDATRYGILSGLDIAIVKPPEFSPTMNNFAADFA
jgi:phage terminase large subunit-like protein